MRFWTADLHLGAGGVIGYASRPFNSIEHMNKRLIDEINMRVTKNDTGICVGDFMNKGRAKGIEGLRISGKEYVKLLNGNWVFIDGNHDEQNNMKTTCTYMFCKIGKYNVFVAHHPTYDIIHSSSLIDYVIKDCDFSICGHVHEKWSEKWSSGFLNINVGVDVRKYRPINDCEIINIYERAKREYDKNY